ncbi:MAG: glycosyltransferase [Brevundimonas sp.]|uniref:glycosyltransferase n=1 Tax=Brevundimonas sp. TaxID=1871086 RepID=UPI00391A1F41
MTAAAELNAQDSARLRGLTRAQALVLMLVLSTLAAGLIWAGASTLVIIERSIALAFVAVIGWRAAALALTVRPVSAPAPLKDMPLKNEELPRYSVICALYREADVLAQLVRNLCALDYPPERLEIILALEHDDAETLRAAHALALPAHMRILVVPPGEPRTKPRALNHALLGATGDLVTIFDAEDAPDPAQLREAAARFHASSPALACLQAPLRIRIHQGSGMVARQFAAEYAALFEASVPAFSRLGLPFALGGTSNHFRAAALRRVGAWDAWNVTEDADLGFRLWRFGYRMGVISAPTWESAPDGVHAWLPQRTRWLKGYLQTLLVHTRHPAQLGWRGGAALLLGIGAALGSAALHALALLWFSTVSLVAMLSSVSPMAHPLAVSLFSIGALVSICGCAIGMRRAALPYRVRDALLAPAYWAMQSLALAHALIQMITAPFHWDKTPHRPEPEEPAESAAASSVVSPRRAKAA